MTDSCKDFRRILGDHGVLTVMSTRKREEAREALFSYLMGVGLLITDTLPLKTERDDSTHEAKKNAAQSTLLVVAHKSPASAGVGYFNSTDCKRT